MVDIPFPRPVRDALLAEGLTEEHRWVPDSGWITFHVRSEEDFNHAVWLLRTSFDGFADRAVAGERFRRVVRDRFCLGHGIAHGNGEASTAHLGYQEGHRRCKRQQNRRRLLFEGKTA